MKKSYFKKPIFSLALAALLILGLAGCKSGSITTKDASQCVQVELDTTYKGKFDDFVDFYSNVTTSDAKKQYNDKIESEAAYFMNIYGVPTPEDRNTTLDPSELQLQRARELYKKIYAKADYSITSSSKQEDGTFAVKVNVKPLDIIKLVDDNFEDGFEAFWVKFDAVDIDSMSDEEYIAWFTGVLAPEYYDTLLDLLEAQIPNMGYLSEKNIVIQVQPAEDGSLLISNEDFDNLDWLIIDYNAD